MKFDRSTDWPYAERSVHEPTGNPLQMVGVVPVLSVAAGVTVLLAGLLICWGMDWPWKAALVAAGVAMLIPWLLFLALYHDWIGLFHRVEVIVGRDITGDGVVGAPPQVTHFELPSGPRGLRIGEIDVPPPVLIAWCRAAASGQSLAYSVWIPQFSLPDGTGGRERYAAFRQWLISQEYAREAGGNVGLAVAFDNPEACDFVYGFARALPEDGRPLLEGGHNADYGG